jgi:diaminopimelate epimerase
MRFVKMEGLGNDFVVLEGRGEVTPELVMTLCDRRRGIGADGVLLTYPVEGQVAMSYWNADGGAAEMCGNGLRCVALLAHLRKWVGDAFIISTAVGRRKARVTDADSIKVELGPVRVLDRRPQIVDGADVFRVSVGNPHAVCFVPSDQAADVGSIGPSLQRAALFPGGTNVEFAEVVDRAHLRLRVWERGVGETLACGTGAAASVAVAAQLGLTERSVEVALPGGKLRVEIDDTGTAWITGPARVVFEGSWSA